MSVPYFRPEEHKGSHQPRPICNEIDEKLYRMATDNDKNIDIIIAGHTHRPVYENLSLTERRAIEKRKKLNSRQAGIYYNTGSCVHPRCIAGIEITMEDSAPSLKLIKWGYDATPETPVCACLCRLHGRQVQTRTGRAAAYNLSIKRTVLEPSGSDRNQADQICQE